MISKLVAHHGIELEAVLLREGFRHGVQLLGVGDVCLLIGELTSEKGSLGNLRSYVHESTRTGNACVI